MNHRSRTTTAWGITLAAGLIAACGAAAHGQPVSHWEMSNPDPNGTPYSNNVVGGPLLEWDFRTNPPATFDPDQTRLETFPDPNTRIAAFDASLNLDTFSFSAIIDPTDMGDFTSILQKESAAPNTFADYQRVGWQVLHTEFGNVEFVVRGTDPGTKDFYGNITVLSAGNGFPAGDSFADPTLYHVAGGYDAATGQAAFYVTQLTGATLTALTGQRTTIDPGAQQDSSPLSVGEADSNGDFVTIGAGYDLDDLQIYDRLLTDQEFLGLANNPGSEAGAAPAGPLDFAEPYGVLDFNDVLEFLNQFDAAIGGP